MNGAEIIRHAAAKLVYRLGSREAITARDLSAVAIVRSATLTEHAGVGGLYAAVCYAPPPHLLAEYIQTRDELAGLFQRAVVDWDLVTQLQAEIDAFPMRESWADTFRNTVVTEGKNAILTHFLKSSTYTASQVLGLIEDTGYSAISATNTAANITAAGGGSPTNGWNEAPSATCAARQTPSFGTASAGSLAASATSHSIIATDTIKGAFLLARSTAGTAPSTTVGNTNGALYSAGLFTGGDRAVANGDTLQVTYTASA